MDEQIVAGDIIRVADPTSAMCGFIGIVVEVDEEDLQEAPYWCNVICPGRYASPRRINQSHMAR